MMRLFAFLDLDHPAVAWAIMRGMIVSADAVPDDSSGRLSFMMAGMIFHQNNTRLYNEAVIEHARTARHPARVSRLRGIYAFESRLLAERMINARDWPCYFQAENLVELEFYLHGEATKVDADWITDAPRNNGRLDLSNLDWIDTYWSGRARSSTPVWETIGNGVGLVLDTSIRKRAYEAVQATFPDCWIFTEMSRLASEAGSAGGLVTPILLRNDDDRLKLTYTIRDADFHDARVVQEMRTHPDFGRLAHRATSVETFTVPDFTPWSKSLTMSVRELSPFGVPIWATHHSA
jgi:hypothetical protein